MTKHARLLAALVLCLAVVVAGPAAAASATPTAPGKPTLTAKLVEKKVKVHGKAHIKGKLDVPDSRGERGLEPIIVQKLVAGVWVDVTTGTCRPNYTFKLSVSFTVAAEYQLRLYHPVSAVASATLLLTVF